MLPPPALLSLCCHRRYQLPDEQPVRSSAAAAALAAIDAQEPDAELRADLMSNALLMPFLGALATQQSTSAHNTAHHPQAWHMMQLGCIVLEDSASCHCISRPQYMYNANSLAVMETAQCRGAARQVGGALLCGRTGVVRHHVVCNIMSCVACRSEALLQQQDQGSELGATVNNLHPG